MFCLLLAFENGYLSFALYTNAKNQKEIRDSFLMEHLFRSILLVAFCVSMTLYWTEQAGPWLGFVSILGLVVYGIVFWLIVDIMNVSLGLPHHQFLRDSLALRLNTTPKTVAEYSWQELQGRVFNRCTDLAITAMRQEKKGLSSQGMEARESIKDLYNLAQRLGLEHGTADGFYHACFNKAEERMKNEPRS